MNFPTPENLFKILDESVIGQTQAKKMMSTAIYSHYLRCMYPEDKIEKSNIIMVGPTGSGKTYIAKLIADALKLPIAIADATSLTQAGYVGEDVENCLLRLIQAAGGDVKLAEKGILFIDEIDKIGRKQESPSITRDVSGEGVQQALLKMIEGSVVNVPASGGRKRPDGVGYIPIDTSNILFICSGAFEGIDRNKINFSTLQKFGMMPELLGRLPIIAKLDELTEPQMIRILTEPKNSIIDQKIKLYRRAGCCLKFTESAIHEIASFAVGQRIGARGLRAIVEAVLLDSMFRLPKIESVVIDREDVIKSLYTLQ